ncbi:hypothetical protein [uncultured Winogradskyella sp.]|uniref:hypothetical protein n=1 Tax=uncultured Winogradskyella sp. TaxID=395353 RepID=UPI00263904B1|nr:hypothetical protein [uncultured Winogradskyella sp.]
MILNNLFSSSIKNSTRAINAKLNETEYLYKSAKIELPFYENYENWIIVVESISNSSFYSITATNETTKKVLEKEIYKNEN